LLPPVKSYQLIAGKLIPFAILGFISVVIVLTGMKFIFEIDVKGEVSFLFVSSFIYILSTLGLGLLVSTFSKTQQQAMMLAVFAIMFTVGLFIRICFPCRKYARNISGYKRNYSTQIFPPNYQRSDSKRSGFCRALARWTRDVCYRSCNSGNKHPPF
jgi:ABC-2 type transport system permease protein